VRWNKKPPVKSDKTQAVRSHKRGVVGYSRKTALLEEAITQMNAGKYGRSSAALKELLALDPNNMEARRLFATLHLRLGSLIPAKQAFDSLIDEAFQRQDYWLAESLLREYLATAQRCVPFLEKLGLIYQEKGDALEAAAEYGKAVDILLEDPDPENPQRATQLYAKIRDLAPASPVAFRLASFFDAQTGDLLAHRSTEEPEPISAPTLNPTAATSDGRVHCEPIDEPMPWELPNPHEAADVYGSPPLPPPPAASDEVPWQETHSPQEHVLFTDTHDSQQTEDETSDVQDEISSEIHTQEVVTTLVEATINGPPDQTASGSVPSGVVKVVQPNSVAEVSITQAETDLTAPRGDGAAPQDQGDGSGETREEALVDVPPRPGTPALPDTTKIAEPPKPVEPDPPEATAENLTDLSGSSKSDPALNKTAEPWLQSGFSWESVFNKAWKIGSQDSGNAVSPEQDSLQIDGPGAETPAGLVSQEPQPESQPEGNHEKDQRLTLRDTTSTGMPIARMPWDQVQESAISIPPAQSDTAIEDATDFTVDQSDDTPGSDWVSTAEESGDKTGLLDMTSHEPDSFSIVRDSETAQPQDPPVSLEDDRAAVDVGQASLSIEEEPVLMEAEPQGSLPGSSMMDELSMFEAPVSAVVEPLSREEPNAEDRTTAQDESHIQSADSVLRIEDESPPADSQPSAQEDSIEPPWHAPQRAHEMIGGITTEDSNYSRSSSSSSSSSLLSSRTEQKLSEPEPEVPLTPPAGIETVGSSAHNNQAAMEAVVEHRSPMRDPEAHQEEWQEMGDSIRFVEEPKAAPVSQASPIVVEVQEPSRPLSAAANAVEVLFESSPDSRKAETRQRAAETPSDRKVGSILSPIRIALTGAIHTGFSTTRAIVAAFIGFIVLSVMVVALTIGAIGLMWVIMEEPPSPSFQSLTTIPQRTLSDFKKNGYLSLFRLDAAAEQDPAQGGDERNSGTNGVRVALTCFGTSGPGTGERSNASADVMRKWFRGSDPVGQFKSHQGAIKGWSHEHQLMLERYGQWKKLPFEDWGYGQPVSPPCATVAFVHQLHVADGFVHSGDQGVDRLETDMEAWRIVLSQARTLPVKMLALQAINDDIAVASGLLVRSDFDGTHLGRVTKLLRPLDQGELSIRWPMQSELVTASKTYGDQLKAAQADAQAVSTTVASMLPLPKQRRLNGYAKYYEASYKAAGEGHYGSLPKWKSYIQFPATTFTDYLTNPIENIVGLEPLPPWDLFNGLVVDTDAHLRLANLQAWLRRGPADGDLLTRLAKAGQGFYDPYTGLPMLVNMKKGVFYSVGHDGKDQDGDPELDVVVEIPVGHAMTDPTKSAVGSSKAK
jgi:hypothetical protein